MKSRLLTPAETAALYQVTLRQLLTLERKGSIPPAVRLNSRVIRFNEQDHPAQILKR
jgi:DNA-binding transcriptional MerR regulator